MTRNDRKAHNSNPGAGGPAESLRAALVVHGDHVHGEPELGLRAGERPDVRLHAAASGRVVLREVTDSQRDQAQPPPRLRRSAHGASKSLVPGGA